MKPANENPRNHVEEPGCTNDGFTGNNLELRQRRSGVCRCGKSARPGQGYCLECHSAAQKRYLARKAERHAADHAAHLKAIATARHQETTT